MTKQMVPEDYDGHGSSGGSGGGPSQPPPTPPPRLKRSERALLVVACVVPPSGEKWEWLYKGVQAGAVAAAMPAYAVYGDVVSLVGESATCDAFVSKLASLGQKRGIKSVDVLLTLHGSESGLYFSDGFVKSSSLRDQITSAGAKNLHALYSTACYGASHAPNFISAGFKVAAGAVGVNCNALTEYPLFVSRWILGWTFKKALDPDNSPADKAQDDLAKAMGFSAANSTANSTKKIYGREDLEFNKLDSGEK